MRLSIALLSAIVALFFTVTAFAQGTPPGPGVAAPAPEPAVAGKNLEPVPAGQDPRLILSPGATPAEAARLQDRATGVQATGPAESLAAALAGFAPERAPDLAELQLPPTPASRSAADSEMPTANWYWSTLEQPWLDVSGHAGAGISLTLRLLRDGQAYAWTTTSTGPDGTWSCSKSACNWQSVPGWSAPTGPGDVLELSGGGRTNSLALTPVASWLDAAGDSISGSTVPGRAVNAALSQENFPGPCQNPVYQGTANAGADGNFRIDYGATLDVNGSAAATVCSPDGQGNATCLRLWGYAIEASVNRTGFRFHMPPSAPFIATWRHDGFTFTYTGTTGINGWAFTQFQSLRDATVGDEMDVHAAGLARHAVLRQVNAYVDANADQARITAPPAWSVRTSFGGPVGAYPYSLRDPLSCVAQATSCIGAIIGQDGATTVPAGYDLPRGAGIALELYDEAGNRFGGYGPFVAPAIAAQVGSQVVTGMWPVDPGTLPPAVTVFDAVGSEISPARPVYHWYSSGAFEGGSTQILRPGYRVRVADGYYTATMTVGDLSAHFDSLTGLLTGRAPAGKLNAGVRAVSDCGNRAAPVTVCGAAVGAGGGYAITFPGRTPHGGSYLDVVSTGADGHYTFRHLAGFRVIVTTGESMFFGQAALAFGNPITVTLSRGGQVLSAQPAEVATEDAFFLELPANITVQPGDTIRLDNGVDSYERTVPTGVTAEPGQSAGWLAGMAPPDSALSAQVWRWTSDAYPWGPANVQTRSDPTGAYRAWFGDLSWTQFSGIAPAEAVDPGQRCSQRAVTFCSPASDVFTIKSPKPPAQTADAYEPDDDLGHAVVYAGPQHHTFHRAGDADWVALTVPPGFGGRYLFSAYNVGPAANFGVTVWDAGGQFPVASWTPPNEAPYRSSWWWQPPAAGTYYVAISGWIAAAYCDAVYDLAITPLTPGPYLPLVRR